MSIYFTLAEAADHMRLSPDTVKAAIARGDLRAKKSGANGGGVFLIRSSDLDEWFESLVDA